MKNKMKWKEWMSRLLSMAQGHCSLSFKQKALTHEPFKLYGWRQLPRMDLKWIACQHSHMVEMAQSFGFNLPIPITACYTPKGCTASTSQWMPAQGCTATLPMVVKITLMLSQAETKYLKELYLGRYSVSKNYQNQFHQDHMLMSAKMSVKAGFGIQLKDNSSVSAVLCGRQYA